MRLMSSRRGFFFSVIAIYLVGALLLSASIKEYSGITSRGEVEKARVLSMNEFLKDVESDLERGIYISGYRAIIGIEEYILKNGEYIQDSNAAFRSAFLNGSVGNYSPEILKGSTFPDWEERISEKAAELNMQLKISNEEVEVMQDDPWNVKVIINLTITLSDTSGIASWNLTKQINSSIPIQDMEDPLFIVNSYGRVSRTIREAHSYSFVSGNSTLGLIEHLNQGYYIQSGTAPSFLMRLEGNLTSSEYGIESLVNISQLAAQGTLPRTASIVDYIYFGNRTTSDICINNSIAEPDLPDWFRLDSDDSHDRVYQITAIGRGC